MKNKITQAGTLGFDKEESKDLIMALNKLLANYQVHYQKLRNFHWNVTGPDFFELHEQFELEYNQVKLNIDVLAERIRIYGARPLSTMKEYIEQATISEAHEKVSSKEMVSEILSDFENLLTDVVTCQELSATSGDTATYNMLTRWAEHLEKRHWMLTAWLGSE